MAGGTPTLHPYYYLLYKGEPSAQGQLFRQSFGENTRFVGAGLRPALPCPPLKPAKKAGKGLPAQERFYLLKALLQGQLLPEAKRHPESQGLGQPEPPRDFDGNLFVLKKIGYEPRNGPEPQ
jgi:hypothetical protein